MKQFKTESKQILDLVANTIYTNHDVFLRELISNASDALDKARGEGTITVSFDKDARTLTVSDTGIGMDARQLEENLGTIARSDSRRLKEALGEDGAQLIGQFGVGFYSAFMVADLVTVISRPQGAGEAHRWESAGNDGFTVCPAQRDDAGTDVVLHIRQSDADNNFERYLDQSTLVGLIRRHSNYVRHPIMMELAEEHFDEATGQLVTDGSQRRLERINAESPLWAEPPETVTRPMLDDFYQQEFGDDEAPLLACALHGRPPLAYDALLFVPSQPPQGLWEKGYRRGLRLYSAGVLIEEACEALLPDHLRFVQGTLDTTQLALNLSREAIAEDGRLAIIGRQVELCVMDHLKQMAKDDRPAYERFFAAYGTGLKFSICASHGDNAPLLQDLLLYRSAANGRLQTLGEFAEAAKRAGRSDICYAAGSSVDQLMRSAAVQAAIAAGLDIALCTGGAQDELCLMTMGTYKGTPFVSVNSADFSVAPQAPSKGPQNPKQGDVIREMCELLRDASPEPLLAVVPSRLLTSAQDAASRLVTEGPVTLSMVRYGAKRARGGPRPAFPLILELNCDHNLFSLALQAHRLHEGAMLADIAAVLLGQALLAEDIPLADSGTFNDATNRIIAALAQKSCNGQERDKEGSN